MKQLEDYTIDELYQEIKRRGNYVEIVTDMVIRMIEMDELETMGHHEPVLTAKDIYIIVERMYICDSTLIEMAEDIVIDHLHEHYPKLFK